MDRGAGRAAVHGVAESQTRISDRTTTTQQRTSFQLRGMICVSQRQASEFGRTDVLPPRSGC